MVCICNDLNRRRYIRETGMDNKINSNNIIIWRQTWMIYGLLSVAFIALFVLSYTGIAEMVRVWDTKEEYGYGYIIPFITLFLIWQHKDVLEKTSFTGSWLAIFVVLIGIFFTFVGALTTITTLIQYGMLLALIGVVFSYLGSTIKVILVPLLFLVFMIPLPGFFLNNLSAHLQLISSELGVAVIRLFGISVYLEGNVIDLGSFKLQVVEACSGLNYLFPLMSLAFIAAYFFKVSLWKRAVIFLSSIPITVLMNSFRIGVIGNLVDKWGIEQAEGFLHYFEGWIIFMACMLILFGEMWLLNRFSSGNRSLQEVFGIEFPEETPENAEIKTRKTPASLVVATAIVLIASVVGGSIDTREEIIPHRLAFNKFPIKISEWLGHESSIEKKYLDVLKLDDYIVSDYEKPNGDIVNFYSAYYQSQRGGASAHSPRSCIPGGGWQIKAFETIKLQGISHGGQPLAVNRLLIKKGDYGQLVYYWFQQRGRIITNEYMVKLYLLWDALTMNRTDGALVRVTTVLQPGEDVEDADARLVSFLKDAEPVIESYIPD